ncbi:peptidase S8/S53 domain-containing protein [Lipomyces chichibuensis]|uniref:peptidase S8/S53 domain-containing protein n=1 Tax=Lipomyces chichibuensis TaxID=1546026 RepID=UPI0033437424
MVLFSKFICLITIPVELALFLQLATASNSTNDTAPEDNYDYSESSIQDIAPPPPTLAVNSADADDDEFSFNSIVLDGEEYPKFFIRARSLRDRYIVVFKENATAEQIATHYTWMNREISVTGHKFRQRIFRRFDKVLHAYAGRFVRPFAFMIAMRPEVDFVESDIVMHMSDVQYDAGYNLARLSHRKRVTGKNDNVFMYDENPGLGVTVYVLDTGIMVDHEEFQPDRATFVNLVLLSSPKDRAGHGTHVAGTAVGNTFGVAKSANVVGVKVLNDLGSGSASTIISGLQYVADKHADNGGPSVINMSLGGSFSQSLNKAVRNTISQGIHVVTAAGNNRGGNACNISPASDPSVMTVAASDEQDGVAAFSNVGPCVDVFACDIASNVFKPSATSTNFLRPGANIRSSWINHRGSSRTLSGTSMSAPLVSGLTAYLVAKDPGASVADIQEQIRDLATRNLLDGIPESPAGTPNLIAFNGYQSTSDEDVQEEE